MSFRQTEILEIARREGKVTVEGLADRFGVTLQTIRRDLTDLADQGRLARVHGGAVLPSGTVNIAYEERRALHSAAKTAIGQAAAALVAPGAAVCLNIGTTTEAVAHALSGHDDLMMVTNNLNIAAIRQAQGAECLVTGGRLRPADGGLVGPLAEEAIGQFRFDIALIGCSALGPDGDLLDFDLDEVRVSRAILRAARETWLVADASKLARTAPARIASLGALTGIVTDLILPEPISALCSETKTQVVIAKTPDEDAR